MSVATQTIKTGFDPNGPFGGLWLPPALRKWLDRSYPRSLSLGTGRYRVQYDLTKGEVVLESLDKGKGWTAPSPSHLPAFSGFRVLLRHGGAFRVLRG